MELDTHDYWMRVVARRYAEAELKEGIEVARASDEKHGKGQKGLPRTRSSWWNLKAKNSSGSKSY